MQPMKLHVGLGDRPTQTGHVGDAPPEEVVGGNRHFGVGAPHGAQRRLLLLGAVSGRRF